MNGSWLVCRNSNKDIKKKMESLNLQSLADEVDDFVRSGGLKLDRFRRFLLSEEDGRLAFGVIALHVPASSLSEYSLQKYECADIHIIWFNFSEQMLPFSARGAELLLLAEDLHQWRTQSVVCASLHATPSTLWPLSYFLSCFSLLITINRSGCRMHPHQIALNCATQRRICSIRSRVYRPMTMPDRA